jgi:hypothetical protein
MFVLKRKRKSIIKIKLFILFITLLVDAQLDFFFFFNSLLHLSHFLINRVICNTKNEVNKKIKIIFLKKYYSILKKNI